MFKQGKMTIASVLIVIGLGHAATGAAIGFKPAVNYPVGMNPRAVVTGDFNGDGKIDLVLANHGDASVNDDGGVSVLLGNGDGTYQSAQNYPAGKNPCPALGCTMAVADFNADRKLDLAVVNSNNAVSILLGNGDGTFQNNVDFATGNGPQSVVADDLNGDNAPDLVVLNLGDSTVSVLLGNGDGTFQSHVDYPAGTALIFGHPTAVAVADVNADGKLDVVVAVGTSGIGTFFGNGDGTLQSAFGCSCGATLGNIINRVAAIGPITAADFNGDGKLDLSLNYAIHEWGGGSHGEGDVLLGNGDGTFEIPPISTGVGGALAATDFDRDRHFDLAGASPGVVSVARGNGDGTFQPPVSFIVGSGNPATSYTDAIAVADLDGDILPDVVVANSIENTVSVLLNTVSTDFSITASNASPSTVRPGQSATATVSLTLLNTFDNPASLGNPASLTCLVQPVRAGSPTCSLNPNSATFDASGKATAQLTITAGKSAASLTRPSALGDFQPWQLAWVPIAGLAFAGAGFGRNNSGPRKRLGLFAGCFLVAILIFQSACGGSRVGPKAQTYTVTVTANSGTTQHSTTVTLTVQQAAGTRG